MRIFCVIAFIIFIFDGCSSSPVLEEVKDEKTQVIPPSGELIRTKNLLQSLSYGGIGLEYESDSTLKFFNEIFADPKTHNRKIKLIYTGLNLSYDPSFESLTIGGTQDKSVVIQYIIKAVPLKKVEAPKTSQP